MAMVGWLSFGGTPQDVLDETRTPDAPSSVRMYRRSGLELRCFLYQEPRTKNYLTTTSLCALDFTPSSWMLVV